MHRRDFLAALAAPALIGLPRKAPRAIAGGFVDDAGAAGHRLRDGIARTAREPRRTPVVVVGAGIAGLCAAWELHRRGVRDFVVLEMERAAGGNSRHGENEITAFPWAAHYVPVPDSHATLVRELFEELGVLRDGVWNERYLCFSPQERLFLHGQWHEGITPDFAAGRAGRAAFARFEDEIARLRDTGQFTIPMERGVRRGSPLDLMTMADWLRDRRLDSPELRWHVDYACRDDYGALAAHTSAWAGVHYFASRAKEESSPLTWPEGNGWIARRLADRFARQLRTSEPAHHIRRAGTRWLVHTSRSTFLADAVIFTAPSFTAPYIAPELQLPPLPLAYSPWLTANLVLDRWPAERGRGAPPAWDNVLFDSPSLGYVVATHQSLATHQARTVWTYYWALSQLSPSEGRRLLLRRTWSEWTDLILADLTRAHPDIRDCVSRVDIMRMGHAMVRPTVRSLTNTERLGALAPPGFYLANSDVSGLPLFEEAQFRGVSAARRAIARIGGLPPGRPAGGG